MKKAGDIELLFWCVLGFLAAQRFTLSSITGYLCLVPLISAFLCFDRNWSRRNALLLIALFWSVDNAVLEYGATPSTIRYVIYVTAVVALIQGTVVRRHWIMLMTLLAVFYLTVTLFHIDTISTNQFSRDAQIMLLLIILFGLRPIKEFSIDIPLVVSTMIGFLISENINFFLLQSVWYGEYMSFDTTKFLIVIPSLLVLLSGRLTLSILLIILTLPVLVGYTGRMLFLSYLLAVASILIFMSQKVGYLRYLLFVGGIMGLASLAAAYIFPELDSFKALYSLQLIMEYGVESIVLLDPVRYASSQLYFDLPFLELAFGRGFGAGLGDIGNHLDFVNLNQGAFSIQELSSNFYYNFHDVWVDVGLRFGLIFFGLFLYWLYKNKQSDNPNLMAIWLVSLIGVITAFYGAASLIATFMLIRVATTKSTGIH